MDWRNKLLKLKPIWVFILYTVLDIFCIGMGMGVPIFCIAFGFIAGWLAAQYLIHREQSFTNIFKAVLRYDLTFAGITLLGMVVIWGPTASMLFDSSKDLANFGIPMILYEPRASFIGWLALMIFISPLLQFLTALFGSYLGLLRRVSLENSTAKAN